MGWTIPESYRNRIPDYMHAGVEAYVNDHRIPGGFLRSVFSNDLVASYGRADLENRAALPAYIELMWNHMPDDSWGNCEKYAAWIKGETGK